MPRLDEGSRIGTKGPFPKIFTKPWSQDFEILAKPEWESAGLYEYVCEENNRCPGGSCGGK